MVKTTTTGKNIATNNYIMRLWSSNHYKEKYINKDNIFSGTLQNVRTKEEKHFDNVAQFQTILHKWYKEDEKSRK